MSPHGAPTSAGGNPRNRDDERNGVYPTIVLGDYPSLVVNQHPRSIYVTYEAA